MTYADIKDLFWTLFGDSEATCPYITSTQLLLWANMGVRELVAESRCLERRQQMQVTSGTQTYDLPDDCDRVFRAALDGDKLENCSLSWLRQRDNRWDQRTSTTREYFCDGLNEQIGLYPIPNVSSTVEETDAGFGGLVASTGFGGIVDTTIADPLEPEYGGMLFEITANELEVYFSCRPPEIDDNDDVPELPPWAQPYVVFYMLQKALMQHTPMREVNRAAYWGGMFQDGKTRLKARANSKLPKEWKLKTGSYGERPRISRLPDIIEVD